MSRMLRIPFVARPAVVQPFLRYVDLLPVPRTDFADEGESCHRVNPHAKWLSESIRPYFRTVRRRVSCVHGVVSGSAPIWVDPDELPGEAI